MIRLKKFAELMSLKPQASMTAVFVEKAKTLFSEWVIDLNGVKYEFVEVEVLLCTKDDTHPDPNIDRADHQYTIGNWYIPEGGVDITFGTPDFAAAIYLRVIKNLETGEQIVGPGACFKELFQNAGPIHGIWPLPKLEERENPIEVELLTLPRIGLSLDERLDNLDQRLRFVFRPYRIARTDSETTLDKYMAALYQNKVQLKPQANKLSSLVYSKYEKYYSIGYDSDSIEELWRISSRSHRMAALLGYLHKHHPDWVM